MIRTSIEVTNEPNQNQSTCPTTPTAPEIVESVGPVISRAAISFGVTDDEMLERLLATPHDLQLDKQGAERVRFIPPQLTGGQIGVYPSDVLVVNRTVNSEETNRVQMQVGALGDLWKDAAKRHGLNVDDWQLASVVPFKVPDYLAGKGQLKQVYLNEGRPLLARVVARSKPKFVLLFGSESLKGFLQLFDPKRAAREKFTNCRGTVLDIAGIKVVCAISPGTVSRDPNQAAEFERDMELFCGLVKDQNVTRPAPTIEVIQTAAELENFVASHIAAKVNYYSLDLEYCGDKTLRTIQLSWAPNTAAVIVLNKAGPDPHVPALQPTELANFALTSLQLQKLLVRPGVGLAGHNMRGDIKVLRQHGLDLLDQFIERGFDTLQAYHLIPGNESRDKQLELVSFRMLGVDRYDKPLREWLQLNAINDEKLEKLGYGTVPDDVLIPYGAMDAICTLELVPLLGEEMAKWPGLENLYSTIVHPLTAPVLEMEETGVLVDRQRLLQLAELFDEKLSFMLDNLQRAANWTPHTSVEQVVRRGKVVEKVVTDGGFNPDSVYQVREILYGYFNLDKEGKIKRASPAHAKIFNLSPVTATDKSSTLWEDVVRMGKERLFSPSTDAENLGILSSESPFAKDLMEYKFCSQMVKNFVGRITTDPDTLEKSWSGGLAEKIDSTDGRLRTRFNTALETGRYSTSPNLQNLPKRQEGAMVKMFTGADGKLDPRYKSLRSVIQASPGHVLVEPDWNSAEVFTLAYLSRDENMIKALNESDVHCIMLRKMFGTKEFKGKLISDYTANELNLLRKKEKELSNMRDSAKTVNFGIPYSRGGPAIQRETKKTGVECTLQDAYQWVKDWHALFASASSFLQECKDAVIHPGYVQTPWGRYRGFSPTEDEEVIAAMQREAGNFPVQGTVGDAMSVALINFHAYRKVDPSVSYKILLSIHDAILFEVPITSLTPMIETVIPLCMCEGVPVPKIGLTYLIGDIDIQLRWGEKADPDELLDLGVPRKYCGFKN